ncbi:hypothetical protein E4S40_05520 [Algoriphagus kandeliae]|uniref:Uncharacterized protein n=1 Tax=Algoriphagus kandeliae TaxID=2562278 RepID=A0A4Y9QT37_9BACT|nr:DUF6090 family protein [Algoriphagus kandeliae]TFV95681.1 hypothetical protein E4S40_05520 [Algoriphagus kandeliae]
MIEFLRRIRQNLISENKIGRYLKYAVGEILLVVIGILIALSINNWNTNRSTQKETLNYLSNLINDLNNDISSFDGNTNFNKTRLKGIFYLLEQAGLNTQRFTEMDWVDVSKNDPQNRLWQGAFPDTLNRDFINLSFQLLGRGFGGVSLNKSVINELYSTGSFSHIKNTNLKTKIGNYYSYLAQRLEGYAIEEHEEWANETTRFFRDKYGIFTLDVSDLEDPIGIIKEKKDAEHHLRYLALEVNYHCVWAQQAKKMALDLIQLIEEEQKLLRN